MFDRENGETDGDVDFKWKTELLLMLFVMLTLFRMRAGAKSPLYQFFSYILTMKVRIRTKKFLIFSSVAPLVWNFIDIPSSSPKLLNLNQENPSKKGLSGQILIIMYNPYTWPPLQFNLSHMIKFCWWRHGQKLWCHNLYFKILLL